MLSSPLFKIKRFMLDELFHRNAVFHFMPFFPIVYIDIDIGIQYEKIE